MQKPTPVILLSFDVEEFDIPIEYKMSISMDEQMRIGHEGTTIISKIIENVNCTLYTTAHYAQQFPEQIQQLSLRHEIASHAFYHSRFETKDLQTSKNCLEQITQKPVIGLRMPRLRPVKVEDIKTAGYQYDSSINPTYLPGRYNNLHLPRTYYWEQKLLRLPVSVTPVFRIPLFWLAFKNIPYPIYKNWVLKTLRKDGYICLYFHPWEFVDLSAYSLPFYIKRKSGVPLQNKLAQLLHDLKTCGVFNTTQQFLQDRRLL